MKIGEANEVRKRAREQLEEDRRMRQLEKEEENLRAIEERQSGIESELRRRQSFLVHKRTQKGRLKELKREQKQTKRALKRMEFEEKHPHLVSTGSGFKKLVKFSASEFRKYREKKHRHEKRLHKEGRKDHALTEKEQKLLAHLLAKRSVNKKKLRDMA